MRTNRHQNTTSTFFNCCCNCEISRSSFQVRAPVKKSIMNIWRITVKRIYIVLVLVLVFMNGILFSQDLSKMKMNVGGGLGYSINNWNSNLATPYSSSNFIINDGFNPISFGIFIDTSYAFARIDYSIASSHVTSTSGAGTIANTVKYSRDGISSINFGMFGKYPMSLESTFTGLTVFPLVGLEYQNNLSYSVTLNGSTTMKTDSQFTDDAIAAMNMLVIVFGVGADYSLENIAKAFFVRPEIRLGINPGSSNFFFKWYNLANIKDQGGIGTALTFNISAGIEL